jgi:GT2 family glycosyltransferase
MIIETLRHLKKDVIASTEDTAGFGLVSPRALVAVLNWNRPAETIDCLESAFNLQYQRFSVLLVDNGSEADVQEQVLSWARKRSLNPIVTKLGNPMPDAPAAGRLTVLETGSNLGYAGGNNVALRLAIEWGFDWVLVLNNDALLGPDFLTKLMATAERWPRSGLIGSRVVPSRPGAQPSYEGGRLLYSLGVYALWRWHGRKGDVSVNFVPGCALLARTRMLAQVGLFDERFFLYTEDVDLSYRALRAGWQLLVNLDTEVVHNVSTSLGGRHSAPYYYYVTRNTLVFIRDRLTGVARLSSLVLFLAQTAVRCAIWIATGRRLHVSAAVAGLSDFAARRLGKAPERVYGG